MRDPQLFGDLHVIFSAPVRNLSLDLAGLDGAVATQIASIEVTTIDGSTVRQEVSVEHGYPPPMTYDLSNLGPLREMHVVDITDPFGIGYDDFRFEIRE